MIVVDGGLAFAVNDPKKLDRMFAAPTARKSALMSVSNPPTAADVRVVADVCARQMTVMATAMPYIGRG